MLSFLQDFPDLKEKTALFLQKDPIMRKIGKTRQDLKNIFIWKYQKKDLNCGKRPLTPIGLQYTVLLSLIKSIMSIS